MFTVALAVAGCDKAAHAPARSSHDPALMAAILAAQNVRTQALHDFVIKGDVVGGTEHVKFTLSFVQPGKLRATLDDSTNQAELTYDGDSLLMVDRTRSMAKRKDLAAMKDEDKLVLLQQVFGKLFADGWRAPLLPPQSTGATLVDGREALVVALRDDTLSEERFFFVKDTHDFDGRSTLDKQGREVAYVHVVERRVDAKTGMMFPVVWEKKDAMGVTTIAVTDFAINAGVDAAVFATAVPADMKVAP